MKCGRCGKEMRDEKGNDLTAKTFYLEVRKDDYNKDFAKKQLGAYKPNKQYAICYECYLKSWNIKP